MNTGKLSESIFNSSVLALIDKIKDEVIIGSGTGEDSVIFKEKIKPGQVIVMTKWAGIVGTSKIAREKELELLERFTQDFLDRAKTLDNNILATKEVKIVLDIGVAFIVNIREGGVNRALWEIAESSPIGIEVNVRDIPIKQETIEICELYDLNPYELISGGSVLIVTDKGSLVVKELQDNGIQAGIIGRIAKGNEKLVINGEYKRYLTPPKNDDLYKFLDLIT